MIERSQIVAEALTWIGTPFQHGQSCKGRGADCVGLVIGVFRALGCVPSDYFPPPYSQQWHVHKNEEVMLQAVTAHGFTPSTAEPEPGDLLTFRFGRVTSHVGIYVGGNAFVHAYFSLQRAVKQPLNGDLKARMGSVFVCPWVS